MNFQDKTLVCKDCGQEFVFTANEQEFYQEKGFQNEPQRCAECRRIAKNNRRNERSSRQMFDVVCSSCGKNCQVPFQPRDDRPVYCSDCYQK